MKFLVLESQKNNLVELKRLLKKIGSIMDYHFFGNSWEEIEKSFFNNEGFDYYFIDLEMTENSAIKLLKTIREYEKKHDKPIKKVFIVTNDDSISRLMNFFSASKDVFIEKNIKEDELRKLLNIDD